MQDTVITPTAIAVDAYATPEALINAILATGGFDGEAVQGQLGSRLATLAAVKVLEMRLKEMSNTLIPEANVEFVNLQKKLEQKQPRAFGVAFRPNRGSTKYTYSAAVLDMEAELKECKEREKETGLALKTVTPPSNGSNFSIVV